jgi:hypothetical protein
MRKMIASPVMAAGRRATSDVAISQRTPGARRIEEYAPLGISPVSRHRLGPARGRGAIIGDAPALVGARTGRGET